MKRAGTRNMWFFFLLGLSLSCEIRVLQTKSCEGYFDQLSHLRF